MVASAWYDLEAFFALQELCARHGLLPRKEYDCLLPVHVISDNTAFERPRAQALSLEAVITASRQSEMGKCLLGVRASREWHKADGGSD